MLEIAQLLFFSSILLFIVVLVTRAHARKTHRLAYSDRVNTHEAHALGQIEHFYNNNSVVKAYHSLQNLKQTLEQRREAFLAARKKQSWWKKLTTEGFDEEAHNRSIREIDTNISALEPNYKTVQTAYEAKSSSIIHRCEMARRAYREEFFKHRDQKFDSLMAVGLLSATASVPISIALDLSKAGDIYDALRSVNANYVDLSDFDIWMQTLIMPEVSLQGLSSLTKGAYFEQLVAEQYQGTLHEHFNHADTDITINGIEHQIKATESLSYIETVDLDTPIIATTEIASASRAIDSGISNVELDAEVAAALGGSLIDISDVALDAALSGLGGVGVMAAISGVGAATRKYSETGNILLATGSGLGATGVGVARTAVNTAELTYKVGRFGTKTVIGGVKLVGKLARK